MIVHVNHGGFGWVFVRELDEGFPHFGFLEDQDLDDLSILTEQLIEVIVGDHVTVFIVDADQKYRAVDWDVHDVQYFVRLYMFI